MLQRFKPEIARALPKHLNADRIARIALTSFRRNPKLGQCDPKSVFAAVIMASQLGWEIGLGGQAYLVPYKDRKTNRYECQLIPGWMGMVDLVFRASRASVWTGAVYDGDEFDFSLGDSPFLTHRPVHVPDARLMEVYAVGRINGAEWPVIEVWPIEKVLAHRDRYNKVGNDHYSYEHFEMYARKVVLLQVLKYLPKSAEVQLAMELDQAASAGAQKLNYKEAIDGSWVPEQAEPEPEEKPAPNSSTAAVKEQMQKRQAAANQEIWPKKEESETP